MRNFNTNQTRHLYVAEAIAASGSEVSNNLDIKLKAVASGEIFFAYKNSDGIIVRSDTIDPKKIVSLKKAYATATDSVPGMDIPLKASKLTVSAVPETGKSVHVDILVEDAIDYDSEYHIIANMNVTSTIDNASKFYNALGRAIFAAIPQKNGKPVAKVYVVKSSTATEVTATSLDVSSATGVVITEQLNKYVPGKLTGEACPLTVTMTVDGEAIGTVAKSTIAELNIALSVSIAPTVYPSKYIIADLEYFSMGERGDMIRGFAFPNDYPFNPAVDLSKNYDMLSIEYYWAGDAENVQKSPRLIEIAMPHAVSDNPIDALYDDVDKYRSGMASS